MACEIWLRRDFLIRHGRTPDEPPCDHDPQQCPRRTPVIDPDPTTLTDLPAELAALVPADLPPDAAFRASVQWRERDYECDGCMCCSQEILDKLDPAAQERVVEWMGDRYPVEVQDGEASP